MKRLAICICVLAAVASHGLAEAQPWPPAEPPYQPGFPIAFGETSSLVNGSGVAFGYVDQDATLDMVVGTKDGRVFAWSTTGTLLWKYPAFGSLGMGIESKPAIADVDNDGFPEVIVSVGSTLTPNNDGRLLVLSDAGVLQCEFLPNIVATHHEGVFASPSVANLDPSTDELEIAVGSWDGWFRVIRDDCSPWWELHVRDSIWSSAALYDLDGDDVLEIVVGVDSHAEGPPFSTEDGGILHVFRSDGNGELPGFPIQLDEVIYSSPAIGDIDGDGSPDIVVGTGRCWDVASCAPTTPHPGVGEYLSAFSSEGQPLAGWPVATPGEYAISSPALGDLDSDGVLDVVVNTINKTDGSSRVYGLKGDGSPLPGWPVVPTVPADCVSTTSVSTAASPVIADIDATPGPEVVLPMSTELVVLSATGVQLSRASGCAYPPGTLQLRTNFSANSHGAVIDLDNDGDLEVVTAGAAEFSATSAGAIYAWDFAAPAGPDSLPWPQFRVDKVNSGVTPRLGALFRDGFESGDLSRWSSQSGGV